MISENEVSSVAEDNSKKKKAYAPVDSDIHAEGKKSKAPVIIIIVIVAILFGLCSRARGCWCGIVDRLQGIVRVGILPRINHRANSLLAITDELTRCMIDNTEAVIAGFAVAVIPIQCRNTTIPHCFAYIAEIIETEFLVSCRCTTHGSELSKINRNTAADIHIKQAV